MDFDGHSPANGHVVPAICNQVEDAPRAPDDIGHANAGDIEIGAIAAELDAGTGTARPIEGDRRTANAQSERGLVRRVLGGSAATV
jgi:hypothetical protein